MKYLRWTAWSFAFSATALAVIFLLWRNDSDERVAALVDIGGPFRLTAADGSTVDSAQLKGRPYAVFFGFTHCPEVCPTTLYEMTTTLQKLGDAAADFRLFLITVDPERDNAAFLKDYLANFDPRIVALVPTAAELADVAHKFRALYEKVPTSDGSYTMNHTALIYLMNRDGYFAGTISYDDSSEARLAKMTRLLAG